MMFLTGLLALGIVVQLALGIEVSVFQFLIVGALASATFQSWRKAQAEKEWMENNYRHYG